MIRTLLALCTVLAAPLAAVEHLPEHQPYRRVLTLRNPYDRAVRVTNVDTTCSCQQVTLDEHFLLPKATVHLTIAVDNANRSGEQRMAASLHLSDPELEPIDVEVRWVVDPDVVVDALAPQADPASRPAEDAWRDVYRYVVHERPDEPQRLYKRIRLERPDGPLNVLGIEYRGTLWTFTPTRLSANAWLITGNARDPQGMMPEGKREERVVIRTDHEKKAEISLIFASFIDRDSGRGAIDTLLPLEGP